MTIWSAWRMYLYHLLALPRTTQSNHQFTDQIPINLPTKFPSIYRPTSHQFTDQLPFNLPTNFPSIYRPNSHQFTNQLPINLLTNFPSIYRQVAYLFPKQISVLPTSSWKRWVSHPRPLPHTGLTGFDCNLGKNTHEGVCQRLKTMLFGIFKKCGQYLKWFLK